VRALLIFLITFSVYAQHAEQPQKELDHKARLDTIVFSLKEIGKNKTFWLERSSDGENLLRFKLDNREEVQKIDTKNAKQLELDFASSFLTCLYEVESLPGDCQRNFQLELKGEIQELCQKDERKSQVIRLFIERLEKRF
jgi:hypothetical protein